MANQFVAGQTVRVVTRKGHHDAVVESATRWGAKVDGEVFHVATRSNKAKTARVYTLAEIARFVFVRMTIGRLLIDITPKPMTIRFKAAV